LFARSKLKINSILNELIEFKRIFSDNLRHFDFVIGLFSSLTAIYESNTLNSDLGWYSSKVGIQKKDWQCFSADRSLNWKWIILHSNTQKSMSQILRLWYVESMKIVILYRRMSFCFDSTALIIDFPSLVYFIWKIFFWPARDSDPRPLGTLFSIKTSNRNLAFSAMPLLKNLTNNYQYE
jgi:hypothetical protein